MTNGNQILEEAISKWREEMYLAFKRALEEQRTGEPCDDAISRRAVLKLFATHDGKYLFEAIRDLPSVTQKQTEITLESAIDYLHSIGWMQKHDKEMTECAERTGHWEMCEDADGIYGVCDICGTDADFSHYGKAYSYCPNCGARMESEEQA